MAGNGTRFSKAGFTKPKPLIDVMGKPMIERVADCLPIDAEWIFVVQQNHIDEFQIDKVLNDMRPGCTVLSTGGGVTEGAACTVLLAEKFIDNEQPLIIINSDNIIEWDAKDTIERWIATKYDGLILVFNDTDPKWSFAKLDSAGFVTEVAEKQPISDLATAGLYAWRRGSDFVKAAKSMIKQNIRFNNEFYLAPVYNQNISLYGHKIVTHHVVMHGVGVPEDLAIYIKRFESQ